jgi:predicted DNA-binding transcriptional regulator YafY
MRRSERLIRLLELLHDTAEMDGEGLAKACGVSVRTLQRDLDALEAAGFPVYFDHGYHLAAPAMLPAITFTVDQALSLRLAAEAAAPRVEPAAARSLSGAVQRLGEALAAKPPERPPERQLSLTLAVQDPRVEACVVALTGAIVERRTVKLVCLPAAGRDDTSRRMDPYRLLPSEAGGDLLGYCHDRRRIVKLPLTRIKGVSVLQRRFQPMPARLLERHLHRIEPTPPWPVWVRLACRPPLAKSLRKHPLVGSLVWEDAPDGCTIFTLAVRRAEDLIPWILACGDAVEVLEPLALRQEIHRLARAMTERHAPKPTTPATASRSDGGRAGPPSDVPS